MAELIRELTGTYFDLLQNQDLQEATQIEQLDPQVVNSIRECQFSIFKHYAQLVNEAKSLPPLLRTITKLAIAVFNRYAFFTDCCRFHMRHGCGLCRNLFPQELYVEQVQSVVALAEWNLQSAIGAYEKTLIFICDEFAKNGKCNLRICIVIDDVICVCRINKPWNS